ncbi:serine protease snake-like [Anopheles darlingi]|uniref:serine protease snake-like n=1 Tax=Anopheles darlingi TaxID=43151 RepID=UPI0021002CCD|nr:serine protease snake-like [Anopheles darlingi]
MKPNPTSDRSWLAVLLVVLCIAVNYGAGLQEGEQCTHQGEPGVCTPYSRCKPTNRITVCRYSAQEAIVCCPQSMVPSGNSRPVGLSASSGFTSSRDNSERISAQKCNEYKQLTTKSVSISALTLNPTLVQIEVSKCDTVVKLIVGGNVTKPGEFPHMAAIGWPLPSGGYSFDCGGSLISEYYVLTAAHCYLENDDGALPTIVRLGDQNLYRTDDGAEPANYDILRFILHPAFKWREGKYNDLALIQLRQRVIFTDFIRPACLYEGELQPLSTAIATGFGLTEGFGTKANELRKVSLYVYENEVCGVRYRSNRHIRLGIMDSQICVGDQAGGKDTCQGDSGGPLQITRGENQCTFYIVGLTSFGQACGSAVPAIYTKVSAYLDWIESVVWPY